MKWHTTRVAMHTMHSSRSQDWYYYSSIVHTHLLRTSHYPSTIHVCMYYAYYSSNTSSQYAYYSSQQLLVVLATSLVCILSIQEYTFTWCVVVHHVRYHALHDVADADASALSPPKCNVFSKNYMLILCIIITAVSCTQVLASTRIPLSYRTTTTAHLLGPY